MLTPEEARQKIDEQRQEALEKMKAEGASEPRNLEEQALLLIGKDIYETLIKGYTEKQWGRKCTDLPPFIIKRLPVRFVHDNNYFSDRFQGIPMGGFNKLIDGLLDGIETRVNANFFEDRAYWESQADHILYTGKIDEYFGRSIPSTTSATTASTSNTRNWPTWKRTSPSAVAWQSINTTTLRPSSRR